MTSILRAGLIGNLCLLTAYSTSLNAERYRKINGPTNPISVHSPSAAQSEQFDVFFKRFNNNADFQLARISFPLKTVMVDDDNKQSVKYISKREWKYTNLTKIRDIIITKHKAAKRAVTILLEIHDTGVHTEYKFLNKDGKWYLSTILDEST